jgi:hypothetical protein
MKLRWAARALVLALAVLVTNDLAAQAPPSSPADAKFELGQNYPNPFNLDTRIPFTVGAPPQCEEHGRLYKVTLRVYNLLSQLVAVPLLQEGSGSAGTGQPLENVLLSCDRYVAYWDGKSQNAEPVSRGIYLYMLEVDGKQLVKRMFVRR